MNAPSFLLAHPSFHSRRCFTAFQSFRRSPSLDSKPRLEKIFQSMQIPAHIRNRIRCYSQIASGEETTLLDPYDILRNLPKKDITDTTTHPTAIPLPKYLSPSSLSTFQKCPQAFFFRYILKLTPDPPTTPALTRGTCCHTALEELFDLKPSERSLDNLSNLFRRAWKRKRGNRENDSMEDNSDGATPIDNECDCLFRTPDGQFYDIEAEKEWGTTSLHLLKNYYELEDPKSIASHNPLMREMWVHATFDVDNVPFVVRGIIDRIDIYVHPPSGKVQLQIIDYKTGKKPNFKYSPSVNERIEKEQFFNMRLYALVLWKMILETEKTVQTHNIIDPDEIDSNGDNVKPEYKYRLSWELQQKLLKSLAKDDYGEYNNVFNNWSDMLEFLPLRLFYLTSHLDDESTNNPLETRSSEIGKASYLDADLQPNFDQILQETEQDLRSILRDIKTVVDKQDPLAFKHCNNKFCDCHEMRSRFRYGSVWSSE